MANLNQNEASNVLFSECGEKSIPEFLKELSNQALIQSFYKMKNNPEETQWAVLQDILKHADKSEFGQKMGFSEIKTVADFQNMVPISQYGDYASGIEDLQRGQADVLYNGKTPGFIATSGSTGIPKLIPESKNGELIKAMVSQLRTILLLTLAPEVLEPGKKILAIANPAEYGKTEGGIPIGSASGQAAKDIPPEMQRKMVLPIELITAKDLSNEATDYLTILFSLKEKQLAGVVCSNIAHFNILLNKMNAFKEDLITDIRNGQISSEILISEGLRESLKHKLNPDPQRARELEDVLSEQGHLDIASIWPDFSVVSCWMSASAERIVNDIRMRLPAQVKFLEWGYGASEGKFNIPTKPDDPAGFLSLFGYFFEFLAVGEEKPLQVHELKAGGYYELIITSYSGLYRYNMKDIVYVSEIEAHSPRIVFISKASEEIKLDDFNIMTYEMDTYIKQTSAQHNEDIRFFQIITDQTHKKLVLIIEPLTNSTISGIFRTSLENLLISENKAYKENRFQNVMKPLEIIVAKQGYRDSLFTRSIMTGKNVNQTKLKIMVDDYPEEENIINWIKEDNR
ncbi:GH3 auxin-responsive promoter family protein [Acetobacterium bakii]|uniref:GH3 auxin-responsive promoter n=1 Tax=Acetobacterium bakii TaxID=52689 RepID=A0A0L6TYU5_9FIRM|nr:GH3 auxin-responsive promoter family protein [Acetobacterium bakii]KNZ41413.1 hypothetical protein AKG39_12410 [Acetobacterium bakii]